SVLGIERSRDLVASMPVPESAVHLPPPSEWEEMLRDYRQMRLTTGKHPLALLRPRLRRLGVSRRAELSARANGCIVRIAGLVTHLQHPQTSKGVIFGSLEDETGINNIIVWPTVFDTFRDRI